MVLVLLSHRDHKAQVGFGKFFQGALVARFNALGELHFLLRGNQFHLADLLEVFVQGGGFTVGDLFCDL